MPKTAKIAFIGLGVMGYPMAGHLRAAGHEVSVYNRTEAKAESWAGEHGGTAFATPREAAQGCDFVFVCGATMTMFAASLSAMMGCWQE